MAGKTKKNSGDVLLTAFWLGVGSGSRVREDEVMG